MKSLLEFTALAVILRELSGVKCVRGNECNYRKIKIAARGYLPESQFEMTRCAFESEICNCDEGWVTYGISGVYTKPVMIEQAKTGNYTCPEGEDDVFFDPLEGIVKECACVERNDDQSDFDDTFWAMKQDAYTVCIGRLICGRPESGYTIRPRENTGFVDEDEGVVHGKYNFLGPIDVKALINPSNNPNGLDGVFKDHCGFEGDTELSSDAYDTPPACVCMPQGDQSVDCLFVDNVEDLDQDLVTTGFDWLKPFKTCSGGKDERFTCKGLAIYGWGTSDGTGIFTKPIEVDGTFECDHNQEEGDDMLWEFDPVDTQVKQCRCADQWTTKKFERRYKHASNFYAVRSDGEEITCEGDLIAGRPVSSDEGSGGTIGMLGPVEVTNDEDDGNDGPKFVCSYDEMDQVFWQSNECLFSKKFEDALGDAYKDANPTCLCRGLVS